MTSVRCQSSGCGSVLEFELPAAPSAEAAVRATVAHLLANCWEIIDQHIACPRCAARAPYFGIVWDGGARTLAGAA